MSELSRLLAHAPQDTQVAIAFFSPSAQPESWGRTALRDRAETVPGARVIDDIDGREALLFGAINSGHVVVYDRNGILQFQGGITASRGHEGDNLGEDCALAALRGEVPSAECAPTFGCPIAGPETSTACPLCRQETSP